MPLNYESEVRSIAAQVQPPEAAVSESAIEIAVEALALVDQRYGANGETPRPYHNVPHSLGVYRRAVRLTNLLYNYIPENYRDDLYDLATIGTATHDVRQDLGPHKNELASVDYAVKQAAKYPDLNRPVFLKRLSDGGMATDVERDSDNKITQVDLRRKSHDPHKFIMAFADINGIAMEGHARMFKDATNLCYEIFGEPSTAQIYDFLVSQRKFLGQRLNDDQIKGDIEYYFPENTEEVYSVMRKAFHRNIVSSHRIAAAIGEQPQLVNTIDFAARHLDQSMLGAVIGRAIKRYVSVQ